MALNIPSIENPFDPNNPLTDAYAWIVNISLDIYSNNGRVILNINPNEEAWSAPAMRQVSIELGQITKPINENNDTEVRVKTLSELMADPEFAQAYSVLGAKLYAEVLKHPIFENSTIV